MAELSWEERFDKFIKSSNNKLTGYPLIKDLKISDSSNPTFDLLFWENKTNEIVLTTIDFTVQKNVDGKKRAVEFMKKHVPEKMYNWKHFILADKDV